MSLHVVEDGVCGYLWPSASYSWPPAVMFYRCRLFLFFRRLISDVPWPILTKLCRVFEGDRFMKFGQKFGGPFCSKFGGPIGMKFRRDFGQLRNLIVNISRTQQDIINRKTALQTMDSPTQANLIQCTLVHKRLKVGMEF